MKVAVIGDRGGSSNRKRGTGRTSAKIGIASVAAVGAFALSSRVAHAATLTWDPLATGLATGSDGSGNWDNSTTIWSKSATGDTIWSSTAASNPADTAVFGGSVGGGTVMIAPSTIYASQLVFKSLSSGSYTIAGNALSLGSTSPQISLASGATASFSNTITCNFNTYLSGGGNGGTLTSLGTLSVGNLYILTGATFSTAQLSGTTITGFTTGAGGYLRMQGGGFQYTGSTNAILKGGTGGLQIYGSGATFDSSGTGSLTIANVGYNTQSGSNLAHSIQLTGSGNGYAGTLLQDVYSLGVTYSTGFVKSGAGTWTLAGSGTNTGAASITAGTLVVVAQNGLGLGAATVFNGGTLAGVSGTTLSGGTLTLQNGSTLSPGTVPTGVAAGSIAKVIAQSTTLKDGVTLAYNLANANGTIGATADGLIVNGSLTIDKNLVLAVAPGSAPKTGFYRLIDYTGPLIDNSMDPDGHPYSGWTVTGVPGSAVYSFSIGSETVSGTTYNSLLVTFNPIPEPTSLSVLVFGSAALLGRKRRIKGTEVTPR